MTPISHKLLLPIFLLISTFSSSFLLGQSSYNHEMGGPSIPSASAAAYGKYADIPVNHYTGTASIDIPIYSLSEGSIGHNISLNYHSAGNRVTDIASPIGLGWHLNAGGIITRVINGVKDDDKDKGYFYKGDEPFSFGHLNQVADGERDAEPDIFTFNFNGNVGKFIIHPNDTEEVFMIPRSDMRIQIIEEGSNSDFGFKGFIATTPDGTKYYFGHHPTSIDLAREHQLGIDGISEHITSWFLQRIESYDGKHHIDFTYSTNFYRVKYLPSCSKTGYYDDGQVKFVTNSCESDPYTSTIGGLILNTISTTNTTVTFDHFNRLDLYTTTVFGPKGIDAINIQNGNYCIQYDLQHDYFEDPSTPSGEIGIRLKLESVQKKACYTSLSEPPFTFDYYGYAFSGRTYFPNMLSTGMDHWGFPNGKTTNKTDLIPPSCLEDNFGNSICYGTTTNTGSTNRSSDEISMKQGMLKQVTYPTKGYTILDYEANSYPKTNPIETPIRLIDEKTCNASEDQTNCCGTNFFEKTITMTQQIINTGYYKLTYNPTDDFVCFGGNNIFNSSVRLRISDESNLTVHNLEFNSNNPDELTEYFSSLANQLEAGKNYRFLVISGFMEVRLEVVAITEYTNSLCGGLRIKSTRTSDGIHPSRDIIRTFHYGEASDPDKSSGVLYNMPQYAYSLTNNWSILFNSSSIVPLSGMEGYHIGYSRVVVKQNGNGSTEFNFNQEANTDTYSSFPFPPSNLRVNAGTPQLTTTYNEDGAVLSYQLIQKNADFYTTFNNSVYRAIRVKTHFLQGDLTNHAHLKYYTPRTGTYRVGEMTNMLDGITTKTTYQYPNPITTLAPNVISTTNSDGKTREENITYSIDHPFYFIRNYFIDKNMISLPYQRDIYDGGNQVDGSRTIYAFFDSNGENPNTWYLGNGIVRPFRIDRWERTWMGTDIQAGSWELQRTNNKYTTDGFIKEIQKPYWDALTYTYTNKLQTHNKFLNFENDYQYHTGSTLLKKKTNVDGTSTTITYDDLMRTATVRDDCKNITTTYDYYFGSGTGMDRNYTKTTTSYPSKAFSDINSIVTINYTDGLGRTIETVEQHQAPDSAHDIIKAVEYDNQGRVKRQFEPRQANNNNGSFQTPQTTWKHTLNEYYDSPLNRVHKTTPPDWNYPTIYQYGSNSSSDAVKIDSSSTTYNNNLLFKRIVIDGNNNKSISFSDRKGRNILSRRTNNSETASLNYDTYYIYDDKDRQVMVLPPNTNSTQKELIFECQYDGEDRKIINKVPGKERMEYKYDLRDQLIASQDGYLRAKNQWYSYQYDAYGREEFNGIYANDFPTSTPVNGLIPTELLMETIYGTASHEKDKVKTSKVKILDGSNNWLESTTNYNFCGLVQSQTSNNHKELSPTSENTTFFYDGADNPTFTIYNHNAYGNQQTIKTTQTYDHVGRGHLSYFSWNGNNNPIISKSVYDHKDQLISHYQGRTGLTGTREYLQKIDYSYLENGLLHSVNNDNLTGSQRPLMDCPSGLPSPSSPSTATYDSKDLFHLELRYDDPYAGTSALGQKNGNITGIQWQVRGREKQGYGLQYDIYNRLTNADYFDRNSAGTLNESGIYDVSLTYDKRGNIETLSRYGLTQTRDCFEKELIDQLDYNYFSNTNRLSLVQDQTPCADNKHVSKVLDNTELHAVGQTISGDNLVKATGNITYQAGESVTLMAGFEAKGGTTFLAQIADCPTMGYETGGYTQMSNFSNTYDENGNLKKDQQKSTTTTYNHLDLPTEIKFSDGKNITFTYDASGTLLAKELKDQAGTTISTRDYIGGIEYVDGQIESIYHGEGRLHYINGTPRMEYTQSDHLGNTRLSYSDLNGNGIIETPSEILDEMHYYPNGLKMEGAWMNQERFRYGYNGIEELTDFGLGLNHTFYRLHDPALGRWNSVDPQAQTLMNINPYNSMGNSPLMYNDPNGDFIPQLVGGVVGAGLNVF